MQFNPLYIKNKQDFGEYSSRADNAYGAYARPG